MLSHRLARLIHSRCPGLRDVYVHLCTRIGEAVDRPWTSVQVVLGEGLRLGDVEKDIREVVAAELTRIRDFRGELIRGEHAVC